MPPITSSHTRAKKILAILSLVAFVLLVAFLFLLSMSKSSTSLQTEDEFIMRPDMTLLIPVVFDPVNLGAYYDWALVENEDGGDKLIETSSFELYGQTYEFLLATEKARATDTDYTVLDYLALTLMVQNGDTTDTIVYIDLAGDGELDSVYQNDVLLDDPAIAVEAQNRYTMELALARDYMLESATLAAE